MKRRTLLSILLAFILSIALTCLVAMVFARTPKWVIHFSQGNMAYSPLVEDNHHAWLAASYCQMDWDTSSSNGIEKQLVIIDISTGQIKYTLDQDRRNNLESESPDRPIPVIIDNVLYRFTFHRDDVYQYCELRAWDFTKSSNESTLHTWKTHVGLPMSAQFGTPKDGSCPFIVQTGVHLPLPMLFGFGSNLLPSLSLYSAWNAGGLYDISVLPLPEETLLHAHFDLVRFGVLEANSNKVVERTSWTLPSFNWCWPPVIDPEGKWVLYPKFNLGSKLREPLVYRSQDGQLLPFMTHPGHAEYFGVVNGMIHLGGDYLYRVEGDRVNVVRLAGMKLFKPTDKRSLTGEGKILFEFDNDDGRMRVYEPDPGKVAARISYRDMSALLGRPFLANERYVFAWGVADTRPHFIREAAYQFPWINRIWPRTISSTIVQVDTMTSGITVLGHSVFEANRYGVPLKYVYAHKFVEKDKVKTYLNLQCWDAMQGEVAVSNYIALAVLLFVLMLFVPGYARKRLGRAPEPASVPPVPQELECSVQNEVDQEASERVSQAEEENH
ncbi:MAG: hypothetical protein QM703_07675 [Gemmatales bacterium]